MFFFLQRNANCWMPVRPRPFGLLDTWSVWWSVALLCMFGSLCQVAHHHLGDGGGGIWTAVCRDEVDGVPGEDELRSSRRRGRRRIGCVWRWNSISDAMRQVWNWMFYHINFLGTYSKHIFMFELISILIYQDNRYTWLRFMCFSYLPNEDEKCTAFDI